MSSVHKLISGIYKKGSGSYGLQVSSDDISRKTINIIKSDILPKLRIRGDYNGRPLLYKTPKGRLILRTHPVYCFEGNYYGRIYEYHRIKHKDISHTFYMYIYDEIAHEIDESNLDAIIDGLSEPEAELRFASKCKIENEDGRKETETFHIEPSAGRRGLFGSVSRKNIKNYKNMMDNGQVSEEQLGFIIINKKTLFSVNKKMDEPLDPDVPEIPKYIDKFDHELWDNLNDIRDAHREQESYNSITDAIYWLVAGVPKFVDKGVDISNDNIKSGLDQLLESGELLEVNYHKIKTMLKLS